jgi:hypothetical protein
MSDIVPVLDLPPINNRLVCSERLSGKGKGLDGRQLQTSHNNPTVRPPRLELVGDELERTKQIIRDALSARPQSVAYALSNQKYS